MSACQYMITNTVGQSLTGRNLIKLRMFGVGAVVLILAIIMLYFCWILLERLKFCRILSEIPGPKSWPLVGNALQFDRTPQGKGIASKHIMCC